LWGRTHATKYSFVILTCARFNMKLCHSWSHVSGSTRALWDFGSRLNNVMTQTPLPNIYIYWIFQYLYRIFFFVYVYFFVLYMCIFFFFCFLWEWGSGKGTLLPLTYSTYVPFHKFNGVSHNVDMRHKVQHTRLVVVFVVMSLWDQSSRTRVQHMFSMDVLDSFEKMRDYEQLTIEPPNWKECSKFLNR
jgi:hypothetical protein